MSDSQVIQQLNALQRQVEDIYIPELATGRMAYAAAPVTLAAPAGTVTFADIPQTFRHLLLVYCARTDRAAEIDSIIVQFNGDTGNNYDVQFLQATDTTVSANGLLAQSSIISLYCEAANSTANAFSSSGFFIWNYTDTNTFKTVSSLANGVFGNVSADADAYIRILYGKWRSTAAITSITLDQVTGPNFVTNSLFQLYGITE